VTSILPGIKVSSELGGAALIFHDVSHISHPVILLVKNQLYYMNARNQRVISFPNDILISLSHYFEMLLKESARSIHEIIAVLQQAASEKGSPKATYQFSSIEVASYFNGTPDNFNRRRMVLERVVVHQKR
jgi:hypothetical protein